jgi:O-antigen/teichoic acid export membrane protein
MSAPDAAAADRGALLARSVALNVVGQAATLVIGFGASVALARTLGPSDRGLLGVMLALSSLALVVVGAGMPLAVAYHSSRKDARPPALLGNGLVYAAILAAVLVPAAWLARDPIADALSSGRGGTAWVLAAALVPITFLDWTTNNQLVGALRFARYNALIVASKLVYLAGIVVLLGVLDLGVAAAMIAAGIGSLVVIVGAMREILPLGRPVFDPPLLRRLFRYGVRVQVGTLFQSANARLDVLVLGLYRPLGDVGQYVIAQTIAELVMTLALAFRTSILPLVSHYEGDERQRATTVASTRHYGILAGAAMVANAGFGSLVILVGYGAVFEPAIAPMLVLLPGVWFLGLGLVIAGDLGGRGRPGLSSLLGGVAAAFTVGLDFLLIPSMGMMGAALASLVAYSVFGVASLVALSRVSGIPVPTLIVPARSDFGAYRDAARRLRARRAGG